MTEPAHSNPRYLLILGILLGAVALAAGLMRLRPPPEKKDLVVLDVLVDTLDLTSETVHFTVPSQGNVRPGLQTELSAEVAGTIVQVSDSFVAGGMFDGGDILLRIDPSNYTVAVDQAEALVAQRKIEHAGALRLKEKGYRAEAEVASAAAALASAKASLTRARRDLERARIALPYAGMIRNKSVDLGQYVNPGTPLGITFATDYAEVRLPLTDQDLAFVDLPGPAADGKGPQVTLSATRKGRERTWIAWITRSEGVVDEQSRVTYAVARVDDPYALDDNGGAREALPVGTFVRARIEGKTLRDVIKVPRAALRGADQLWFVDDNNTLRIRHVEILRTDAEYAYLAAGAQVGERIVLTSLDTPINGMKVRINQAAENGGLERAVKVEP